MEEDHDDAMLQARAAEARKQIRQGEIEPWDGFRATVWPEDERLITDEDRRAWGIT